MVVPLRLSHGDLYIVGHLRASLMVLGDRHVSSVVSMIALQEGHDECKHQRRKSVTPGENEIGPEGTRKYLWGVLAFVQLICSLVHRPSERPI